MINLDYLTCYYYCDIMFLKFQVFINFVNIMLINNLLTGTISKFFKRFRFIINKKANKFKLLALLLPLYYYTILSLKIF